MKHVLLFYKFVGIKSPKTFAKRHLAVCKKLGLLGKVLVAKEGINGSVSGTRKQTEEYKKLLIKNKEFKDIIFKEEIGKLNPFTRMQVKVKKEIIRLDKKIDLSRRGKYISPKEFLKLYKNKDKDLVILDARNNYEWQVGKFKDAVTLDIRTFRKFPEAIKKLKSMKTKKIVTYCTGGIRCEKASAYLIQKGFKDVSQLKDGIINFCQQYPNTVWQGKCFVFDKRLLSDTEKKNKPITNCTWCDSLCDLYRNCKSKDCDKLFISCPECEKDMDGCCSETCLRTFKEECIAKSIVNQGRKS